MLLSSSQFFQEDTNMFSEQFAYKGDAKSISYLPELQGKVVKAPHLNHSMYEQEIKLKQPRSNRIPKPITSQRVAEAKLRMQQRGKSSGIGGSQRPSTQGGAVKNFLQQNKLRAGQIPMKRTQSSKLSQQITSANASAAKTNNFVSDARSIYS